MERDQFMAYVDSSEGRDLIDTDLVKQHIVKATQWLTDETAAAFHGDLLSRLTKLPPGHQGCAGPNLESPAEAVFEIWARALRKARDSQFWYYRQVSIKGQSGAAYRADFQAVYSNSNRDDIVLPVLIEVDGHAFHEKTRQQVERRNTRDRDLNGAGFTLLHFSFSELTKHPLNCFEEIEVAAWRAMQVHVDRMADSRA